MRVWAFTELPKDFGPICPMIFVWAFPCAFVWASLRKSTCALDLIGICPMICPTLFTGKNFWAFPIKTGFDSSTIAATLSTGATVTASIFLACEKTAGAGLAGPGARAIGPARGQSPGDQGSRFGSGPTPTWRTATRQAVQRQNSL